MKLYYKPGACSLASHITLHELDESFDIERVDTSTQRTETGEDYRTINPKGYVPALRLDSGQVLTEGPAILQYLADRRPEAGLAPKPGLIERATLQSDLNYVASELHKSFGPFFRESTDAQKAKAKAAVARRIAYFEALLCDGRPYIAGETFTVADAYFFVVARWLRPAGIDAAQWPHVAAYLPRVAARPKVKAALRAEGLLQ